MDADRELDVWLENHLAQHSATSRTIHRFRDGGLRLAAAVKQLVAWVPSGKGIAGLAMERREPILTCNLKEDGPATSKPVRKRWTPAPPSQFP
jgi:hypothetical protein